MKVIFISLLPWQPHHIIITLIQIPRQAVQVREHAVWHQHITAHHGAMRFEDRGVPLFDILFLDFFGEAEAEFAGFVEEGEHVAVGGGVRAGFAFAFESGAFGDKFVVDG